MRKKSKAVHLTLLAFALESLPCTAILRKPGKAIQMGSQGEEEVLDVLPRGGGSILGRTVTTPQAARGCQTWPRGWCGAAHR